jgi:hypothetical protein
MSALIFNLNPQQVIVAADTLATAAHTKKPAFFSTKVYPLPHLNGIMCATGLDDLAADWFNQFRRFIAKDILHADQYVTRSLIELGKRHSLDSQQTTTIYHFGYSEVEQRYVGFAYRSENNFVSERREYGLYVKPGAPTAKLETFKDLVSIMSTQRREDNAKPVDERVFIGGEVHCFTLQDKTMTIQTLHRFEDYDDLYTQMCAELPANCG